MGIFITANLVVEMVVPYLFLERVGSKIFLLLGTTVALPLLRRASNFSRDMNERNFKFRNRENPLDFFFTQVHVYLGKQKSRKDMANWATLKK